VSECGDATGAEGRDAVSATGHGWRDSFRAAAEQLRRLAAACLGTCPARSAQLHASAVAIEERAAQDEDDRLRREDFTRRD